MQITILRYDSSIFIPYGNWDGWFFENSASDFRVFLSDKAHENVSWPRPSLLQGWKNLTLNFFSKFGQL